MKAAWLHRAGRPRVLVFFAGWGMDENPFGRLASRDWDVLVYYDYRQMDDIPCLDEVEACPEIALAAWSLGCAAGNHVAKQRNWTLSRALALNGTVITEDAHAGIPTRWLEATVRHLSKGGWEKFVRRMCPDMTSLASFEASLPARDLSGAEEELKALRRLPPPDACVFTTAVVSDEDRIILPENQRRCWDRFGVPVRAVSGPHYLFHLWNSWDEILACAI